MKRTTILFVLLFAVTGVFAQKGKVTSASSFKETGKLDKAVSTIEEAIDSSNPKTESSVTWPRTWEVRGEIYQAVFQSKDENYKKLSNDPLTVAYDSYLKALALDDKDKFSKSIKIKLTLLIGDLTNQAVAAFNEEDYNKALKSFEQIIGIEETPVFKADDPTSVDTVIIFNAGLAAYNAQNYDKAIKYYKEAAKYNYSGARTYQLISSSYMQKQDTVGALQILQEGLKKYSSKKQIAIGMTKGEVIEILGNPKSISKTTTSNSNDELMFYNNGEINIDKNGYVTYIHGNINKNESGQLLVEVINIYLNSNRVDDALKYLDIAIEQDPTNSSYYFAQGTLFDKLQKPEEATTSYLKAIEYKDDYFDAYYNLGAVYYNKGVKQIDVANAVPSNQPEKYEEEKEKADIEFKKAIPYMEKAHEVNPTDKFTMESLKTLYYRLKMLDKHAEIVEKMKNL